MKISLDGDWIFKGYTGEEWLRRGAHKPGANDPDGWLPGRVPGSVHHDLWQSGQIPNPYLERNSLRVEWVRARTWVYKKSFTAGEELRGRRVRLCFQGVRDSARYFLNGEPLGNPAGRFTPAGFEVSDLLHFGQENLLAVVIDLGPAGQPQARPHQSRPTSEWDSCPPTVHQGIWEAVYLEVTGLVRIEDLWVRTQLSEDLNRGELRVSAEFSISWPAALPPGFPAREGRATQRVTAFPVEVEVDLVLLCRGEFVAGQQAICDITFSGGRLNTRFVIDDPYLWWPNGEGEQTLYELEMRVMDPLVPGQSLRAESHSRSVQFGIRKIELISNDDASPEAHPFTLSVNGRRVSVRGWNWAPMDAQFGVERPDKLQRLLSLARREHVNLLRLGKGGLIEMDSFYDLCDRLGILIWQDFVQSGSGVESRLPEDPELIQTLVKQAGWIILRLRNHPSLALWCGGNEAQDAPDRPADDPHPLLAALHEVISQLDPGRPWLPTSPSGLTSGDSLDASSWLWKA